MFYSHEILTDRKHGVATIWLVATLGSKSSLRKITRKAIMDVNVPNACGTITDPVAPMALRLQGNLLYGVSRVFSQQCAYVLTDMQSLRDRMRGLDIVLKTLEIDPNVVATRPEQLNLQADPTFNIDLDLGFDLSNFDTDSSTEPSSLLSPRTLSTSQTGSLDQENALKLAAPLDYSSSHGVGGGIDFGFDDMDEGFEDDLQIPAVGVAMNVPEDDAHELGGREDAEDNLLEIADDGTLLLRDGYMPDVLTSDSIVAQDAFPNIELDDDAFNHPVDADYTDTANNLAEFDNDADFNFEHGEAQNRESQSPERLSRIIGLVHRENTQEIDRRVDEGDVVTGTAPEHAARTRAVPFDDPAEVPNRTLAEWNNDYLYHMESARSDKLGKISVAQAKRNAAYWILDQGLGEIAANFREDYEEHPLAVFSGQDLIDALVGPVEQRENKKRSATVLGEVSNPEGSQGSKRARTQSITRAPSIQVGRGEFRLGDEDDLGITLDEEDFEAQVGRGEQVALSDHFSDMPWNAYASSRAGSVRMGMSAAGASSSAQARRTVDVYLPSSNVKRVSQLIRESPMERRRRMMHSSVHGGSSQDNNELMSLGGDFEMEDDDLDARLAGDPDEEFELNLPLGDPSTEDSATNRWISENLEKEAFNFLDFLRTTIQHKVDTGVEQQDMTQDSVVTFEELLPLDSNNEIVAAQGLLHVLSLATKGLINVKQDEAFGSIELGVISHIGDEFGEEGAAGEPDEL